MIRVTEDNRLVNTNISYCMGEVHSVINVDRTTIALCKDNGMRVYNKKYKK